MADNLLKNSDFRASAPGVAPWIAGGEFTVTEGYLELLPEAEVTQTVATVAGTVYELRASFGVLRGTGAMRVGSEHDGSAQMRLLEPGRLEAEIRFVAKGDSTLVGFYAMDSKLALIDVSLTPTQ